MKVLLLADVAGIGQKGSIKELADGHALNKLIPNKQAVIATPEKIKEHEKRTAELARDHEKQEKIWKEQKERLEGVKIVLKVNANTQGHLYEKVSTREIATALQERGFVVPAEHIHVDIPIKQTGSWPIKILLGSQEAKITIVITS